MKDLSTDISRLNCPFKPLINTKSEQLSKGRIHGYLNTQTLSKSPTKSQRSVSSQRTSVKSRSPTFAQKRPTVVSKKELTFDARGNKWDQADKENLAKSFANRGRDDEYKPSIGRLMEKLSKMR